MAEADRKRSARIIEQAMRVVELTPQLDTAQDVVERLERQRQVALLELVRLAGGDDGSGLFRIVRDVVLIVIVKEGARGLSIEALTRKTRDRLKLEVSPDDIALALDALIESDDLRRRDDLVVPGPRAGKPQRRSGGRPAGSPTHRQMILQVLREAPSPLGVSEIVKAVKTLFGEEVSRTSISPLLAKLERQGGIVVHVGEAWTVTET